jgi:glycosyltransferase involved in cell wall biosynthesis
LERWASWFAQQGYDVTVISISGRGRYPSSVRQFRLGLRGRGPRWVRIKLWLLLSRIKPDIVHVHWAHFAVPVRQVWSGPLVVTAWGSDVYRSEKFTRDERLALGATLRATDLVTCDSQDLALTIRNEFDVKADQIKLVQWGVNAELFRPDGAALRTALGLEDREVILSVRNFTALYNLETIVAAFAEVRRKRSRAFLLMKRYGGDAEYVNRIRADIEHRGLTRDVRIIDSVPYEEMPALYRTADVMVSIPISDAAPMSLFEAMACGVPSVVCNLPSLREWVDDGVTGCLVDALDATAVAAAIVRLLTDGDARLRMGEQARSLALQKASQEVHMNAMAHHYRNLMEN